MKHFIFFTVILFYSITLSAQQNQTLKDWFIYDTDLLSADFHKERREVLRKKMPSNSVAVIFSNSVKNRSNDVNFEFKQSPDFYYLTGYNEPNGMVMIFSNPIEIDSIVTNEILFVQPRDPADEIWHGRRLGTKGANEILGFETSIDNNKFATFPIDFGQFGNILYIHPGSEHKDDQRNKGDIASMLKHFERKIEPHKDKSDIAKLPLLMADIRSVKTQQEINLMVKAIEFTCEAQRELMKSLDEDHTEYQSEALVEFIFKKNGSEYPGFPSIVGGGENSCVLHYTSNRKPLEGGNMLVVDIGAEYHGYSADVTRTMPVDGKFSEEEKAIYNLVLKAQTAGVEASVVGNKFWEPGTVARKIIQDGLLELGITKVAGEWQKYFPHGTSHYLGLDVHDAGTYGPLRAGEVITVEPGIYIPADSDCDPKWWNIGVRIEDDILITEAGPENLSDCVPKTIEEIEALMEQPSLYQEIIKN